MTSFTESTVEDAALDWLESPGWSIRPRVGHRARSPGAERDDYGAVVLEGRLRDALARLNPTLPTEALDDAFRKLTLPEGPTLEAHNRAFHRMLVDGVTVEHRTNSGEVRGAQAQVIDFDTPVNNNWLAVNQFTVVENKHERRPDVVLFVNGLPLGVIELKNPADEDATIWTAWQQLQTYKAELPTLFSVNEALLVSDGVEARIGTLTAGQEWFKPWRTISGEILADPHMPELQVMLEGVYAPHRFLSLVRDFIVFEDDGSGVLVKKMAGYHQFRAVRVAVTETLRAAELELAEGQAGEQFGRYESGRKPGGEPGDRRIGVVWHTQGSGKSLTVAFYAGRIIREPAMANPTVVMLTDRNDLDEQLFGTFACCRELLRQPPMQAASRADLRAKLAVESGGVVFTTIQKFFPEEPSAGEREGHTPRTGKRGDQHPLLSERRNIVVIADEAHRIQYDFIDGKAMVVCMGRRICIELYRELVRLHPDWHQDEDDKGQIKVVMTDSASDPPGWQPHIRTKSRRKALAKRFRNPGDPLCLVLVRDMWLTGFDASSLYTMYMDKPMRGHGLMQAIARVNRVFRDKPGGLVVDYLGLAHELKRALAIYTQSGGTGGTAFNQERAVEVMQEKYEVCCDLLHGFDRSQWTTGAPTERLALSPAAQEHILAQENGKDRHLAAVQELSQAFSLAVPHEAALHIRDEVAFFQAVRSVLAKRASGDARPEEELDHAVRQIVSRTVASEGVIDIFSAAGLEKPDISVLSDEFLAEVRDMPQRNLAVELLQKLLKGELAVRRRKNVVQARSFAEMLEHTLRRYQNRTVEAAQVIEELIQLAQELREASARGEKLGLSEDEGAFYDALETNDSAVQVLGDEILRDIARELVQTVRDNVTIDWTLRENVRADLRRLVKRILRKHGYPPDK